MGPYPLPHRQTEAVAHVLASRPCTAGSNGPSLGSNVAVNHASLSNPCARYAWRGSRVSGGTPLPLEAILGGRARSSATGAEEICRR